MYIHPPIFELPRIIKYFLLYFRDTWRVWPKPPFGTFRTLSKMSSVWETASSQARAMLGEFAEPSTSGQHDITNGASERMQRITVNVIASIGYGIQRSWAETTIAKPPQGLTTTLWSSLLTIVHHPYLTVFVPAKILSFPLMPKAVKEIGLSKTEYPLHLQETIAQERRNPSSGNSLLASLVRLSEIGTSQTSKQSAFLTDEEITGNLYGMTIAGFDSTAATLSYALMMLVIEPKRQEWIIEEVDEVLKLSLGSDYSTVFARLPRCLALMYETLRLCGPIPNSARQVFAPQDIEDKHFPPGTIIQISSPDIHTNPEIWGVDAEEFRPSRWLKDDGKLHEPAPGEFLPWSFGPRLCPGIKMSQVEFLATMWEIFCGWRIEIVQREGETVEDARKRAGALVEDS
ncbi:putative cytochrome P450, partial [Lachnellula occidentalis]